MNIQTGKVVGEDEKKKEHVSEYGNHPATV